MAWVSRPMGLRRAGNHGSGDPCHTREKLVATASVDSLQGMRYPVRRLLLALIVNVPWLVPGAFGAAGLPPPFELKEGDRVVLLGDALIEGEQRDGWIETMLTSRFNTFFSIPMLYCMVAQQNGGL